MKVVVAEPIMLPEERVRSLFNFILPGDELVYFDELSSEEMLIPRATDAEILVVSTFPVSRRVIESAANLVMISVSFIGFDHIDLAAAKERGIIVTNTPGYCKESVAEVAVCFAINLLRLINKCEKNVRAGRWREGLSGRELCGLTVGVVGLGNIGSEVARLFLAFGCRVVAYNRSPKNIDGIMQVGLDELLTQSDIITLHLALNDKTHGFIGKEQLDLVKEGSFLINLARGPIVEKRALVDALASGRLAGAAIDVYDKEPVSPNDELLDFENILVTPHIGFFTAEALERKATMTFQNVKAFMEGQPINVVEGL